MRKEMWHARGRSPSRILRASVTGRNGASKAASIQHVGELSARSRVDEEEREVPPFPSEKMNILRAVLFSDKHQHTQCVHTTSRNAFRPPTRAPLAKPHTALRPPRATAQSSRCERRCACGAADLCFPWPIYRQMPVQTCTNPSFSLRRPLRLPPRCAVGPLVERCRERNRANRLAPSLLQDARRERNAVS